MKRLSAFAAALEGGVIVADKAATSGHLVTKKPYKDFQLRAEFFDITAKGDTITVMFNGEKAVELKDSKQPGAPIKWRKVQVREL